VRVKGSTVWTCVLERGSCLHAMEQTNHAHPQGGWSTLYPSFDTLLATSPRWPTSQPASLPLQSVTGQPQAPLDAPPFPMGVSTTETFSLGAECPPTDRTRYRTRERLPPLRSAFGNLVSAGTSRQSQPGPEAAATAGPSELLRPQPAATAATTTSAAAAAVTVTPSGEATSVETTNLATQTPQTRGRTVGPTLSPGSMQQSSTFSHTLVPMQTNSPWFLNPFLPTETHQRLQHQHHANEPARSSRPTNFHISPPPLPCRFTSLSKPPAYTQFALTWCLLLHIPRVYSLFVVSAFAFVAHLPFHFTAVVVFPLIFPSFHLIPLSQGRNEH
jgi:hypothetical protein